jgi:hypothetical protein
VWGSAVKRTCNLRSLVAVLVATAIPVPPATAGNDVDNSVFTQVLQAHVRAGRVDYPALCHDERLDEYLAVLSAVDPDSITGGRSQLAFWINAYNAFTLKVVCDGYPVKSIRDVGFGGPVVGTVLKKTVWDRKFIVINGETLSLNDIEHDIIRKRFGDPRIHFALVCAAKSCPRLRSEAYDGTKLVDQLVNQAFIFFANKNKNRFDLDAKVAYLSKILDWYGDDFGENSRERLLAIAPYLPTKVREAIERDPGAWRISYLDYDWSLNE